jgi:hypothetical protein
MDFWEAALSKNSPYGLASCPPNMTVGFSGTPFYQTEITKSNTQIQVSKAYFHKTQILKI